MDVEESVSLLEREPREYTDLEENPVSAAPQT
jgi:hypothetical protein